MEDCLAYPFLKIHDALPGQSSTYTLFAFVGVSAAIRKKIDEDLHTAVIDQLERLFGPDARQTIELIVQDWACEPETATQLDYTPHYGHPAFGLPHALANLWQSQLIFGSTEVATNVGGYLEGALDASEQVAQKLICCSRAQGSCHES